jgi:hypothetical protein
MIGLETEESIQCLLCQRLIKLDLNDPEKSNTGINLAWVRLEFPNILLIGRL